MIQFTPLTRRLKFLVIFFVVFITTICSDAFAQFITPITPLSLTQQQNKIIEFNLINSQPIKLELLNSSGGKIKTVFEGSLQAGKHAEIVNTRGLAKGVYLYKLTGKSFSITKKLVIQ